MCSWKMQRPSLHLHLHQRLHLHSHQHRPHHTLHTPPNLLAAAPPQLHPHSCARSCPQQLPLNPSPLTWLSLASMTWASPQHTDQVWCTTTPPAHTTSEDPSAIDGLTKTAIKDLEDVGHKVAELARTAASDVSKVQACRC